jgi:hypothetical protein
MPASIPLHCPISATIRGLPCRRIAEELEQGRLTSRPKQHEQHLFLLNPVATWAPLSPGQDRRPETIRMLDTTNNRITPMHRRNVL